MVVNPTKTFIKKSIFIRLWCVFIGLSFANCAYAFVLVSGREEAKLDSSIAKPEVNFLVSSQAPEIEQVSEFLESIEKSESIDPQDTTAVWDLIIQKSMLLWNEVENSYLKLTYESTSSVEIDADDRLHSIGFSTTSINTAAFATPRFDDGVIYDCDISVGKRVTSAESLAYTLAHELGHCLGLGHAHNDRDALMGYTRTDRSLRLGSDDQAGLIYLYPDSKTQQSAKDLLLACGSTGQAKGQKGSLILLLLMLVGPLFLIRQRFIDIQ